MSLARAPQKAKASVGALLTRVIFTLIFLAVIGGIGWAYLVNNQANSFETLDPVAGAPGEFVTLSNGRTLHYQVVGSGPSILMIHGFDVAGGARWQALAAELQGYRLIIPDLVDFGFSERPSRPGRDHTVFGQAATVALFLEQIGIESASVIGAGWGGNVAAQLAVNDPDLVDRLVLIGPEILSPQPAWTDMAFAWPVIGQALNFTFHGGGSRATVRYGAECASGGFCPAASDLEARQLRASVAGTSSALTALAATPGASTVPADLPLINTPTLLVWGENDAVTPLTDGRQLAQSIPEAAIEVVAGAGHQPDRQLPGPTADLIEAFLGA